MSDSFDLLLLAAGFVLLASLVLRADEPALDVACFVDLDDSVLRADSGLDAGLLLIPSEDLLEVPGL